MKVEPKKSKSIKTPKPLRILVPTEFSRNADEAVRFAVDLAATLPQDVKIHVQLRQGAPHTGIIDAARQDRCDLIALPTRGLKGLKYYMLGSTAEKVVRYALCPVLTFNRCLTAPLKN
jgi:nucleotide-binding universal stress UspA family protein